MSAHYVYRVYDDTGRLIYVGSTKNLFGRLDYHRRNTWWAHQAARVSAEVHSYEVALSEERAAIRNEKPRWNLIGVWGSHSTWTRERFHDYITAYRNGANPDTDYGRTHLKTVYRAYEVMFGSPFGEVA